MFEVGKLNWNWKNKKIYEQGQHLSLSHNAAHHLACHFKNQRDLRQQNGIYFLFQLLGDVQNFTGALHHLRFTDPNKLEYINVHAIWPSTRLLIFSTNHVLVLRLRISKLDGLETPHKKTMLNFDNNCFYHCRVIQSSNAKRPWQETKILNDGLWRNGFIDLLRRTEGNKNHRIVNRNPQFIFCITIKKLQFH